ncbi:MAG TPA: DUF1573 domain-containing protein [Opitutaceae bacterium]|jgi:hypothetical protein
MRCLELLFGFALAAAGGADPGGLVWSRTQTDLTGSAHDEIIEADFAFRNGGLKPVRITGLDSSCRCTTAAPGRWSYAPGDNGKIHVVFRVAGRTGHFDELVEVQTDTAGNQELRLGVTTR